MISWDERVRGVGIAARDQRAADNELFNTIWRYPNDRRDEDIETTETETLPDGRTKARWLWRGARAFSWYVRDGKAIVGREGEQEQPFGDLEAAYQRMAEHMWDLKDRAWREQNGPG